MKPFAGICSFIIGVLLILSPSCKSASNDATPSPPVTATVSTPQGTPIASATAQQEQSQAVKFPPRRTFKHKFKIVSKFDKFQDMTNYFLEPMPVANGISVGGGFFHKGKELTEPVILALFSVTSESEGWRFLDGRSRNLTFLVDGESLKLGEMMRNGDVENGGVTEYLNFPIPTDKFLKIVNADKVEVQVGTTEFALKESHLEALRDLASRMTP